MPDIIITADPVPTIEVVLVGVTYFIHPPKAALAMKLSVQAKVAGDDPALLQTLMDEWVDSAFRDDADAVRARIADMHDDLDSIHMARLLERVIEATSGDRSTSSSASPPSPSKTGKTSTGGRRR